MGTKTSLATAVMAVGAAAGVQAAAVTVSQTVSLGSLLQGDSRALQFDFGSSLGGLDAANVLSGELVVYGISDASYGTGVGQEYGGYEQIGSRSYITYVFAGYAFGGCRYYTWSSSCWYYSVYSPVNATDVDYGRSRDVLHQDSVIDALRIGAGGSESDASVQAQARTYGDYGNWQLTSTVSRYPNGYDRYYDRERDAYEGYFGELSATLALDAAALSDFGQDAVLGVSFLGLAGQFSELSATLTLRIDDASTGGSVPEPGTLLLAGAALAATAASRRRRRAG